MGAPRVLELPTTVDLSRYPLATGTADGDFIIGWIGSPANAATYLPPLAGVLAELTAGAGVRLDLIGSADRAGWRQRPQPALERGGRRPADQRLRRRHHALAPR